MTKIATVETEARIGEVIPEKRIETRMRSMASRVLIKTDASIGQKNICPPWKNKIAKRTVVESSVTTTVVSVNPRHLPIMISIWVIGLGRIR